MSSQTDLLYSVGTDVLRAFVAVLVETWAVVIYTVLVVKAGLIFRNRKIRRQGIFGASMMIVVLVMWCLNTSLWIIDVRNVIIELKITLIENSGDSLDIRYQNTYSKQLPLWLVEDAIFAYMTLLGDAIVLWRVNAFWQERKERFFLIIPGAVYLASVVLANLLAFCAAQSGADIETGSFTDPPFCANIQWSSYWAQFSTAVVSTVMIAYKTWKYRRLIRSYLGAAQTGSPVYGAMMIIIDTGVIYALYFLVPVILGFTSLKRAVTNDFNGSFALQIYQYSTSSIVGIYPTVVVILVHTHCMLIDSKDDPDVTVSAMHWQSSSSGKDNSRPSETTIESVNSPDNKAIHRVRIRQIRTMDNDDELELGYIGSLLVENADEKDRQATPVPQSVDELSEV